MKVRREHHNSGNRVEGEIFRKGSARVGGYGNIKIVKVECFGLELYGATWNRVKIDVVLPRECKVGTIKIMRVQVDRRSGSHSDRYACR